MQHVTRTWEKKEQKRPQKTQKITRKRNLGSGTCFHPDNCQKWLRLISLEPSICTELEPKLKKGTSVWHTAKIETKGNVIAGGRTTRCRTKGQTPGWLGALKIWVQRRPRPRDCLGDCGLRLCRRLDLGEASSYQIIRLSCLVGGVCLIWDGLGLQKSQFHQDLLTLQNGGRSICWAIAGDHQFKGETPAVSDSSSLEWSGDLFHAPAPVQGSWWNVRVNHPGWSVGCFWLP